MKNGEIILYAAEDGSAVIQLRAEGGDCLADSHRNCRSFSNYPAKHNSSYTRGL